VAGLIYLLKKTMKSKVVVFLEDCALACPLEAGKIRTRKIGKGLPVDHPEVRLIVAVYPVPDLEGQAGSHLRGNKVVAAC